MSCYGTKCIDTSFEWKPETLAELYRSVEQEFGAVQLNKPRPGDTYRKMHKPISEMDGPAFRRLPPDIVVISPPRLFRSTGWKYRNTVYLDAECHWQFEYETAPYIQNYQRGWLPVRILSYAYIFSTISHQNPLKSS